MIRHLRSSCLRLHRWFGLTAGLFLVLMGLTGTVLAFYEELDAWMAPQLLATDRPAQPRLSLAELAERAQALAPDVQVVESTWRHGGLQAEIRTRARPDSAPSAQPDFDSLLLDPWTGKELGRRTWGDISQGTINLIPFIYRLHYELALGQTAAWLLGLIALGWTLDCFGGLFLTLPMPTQRRKAQQSRRSFWSRWAPSWQIKRAASGIRRIFDLHRAVSLWVWLVLLTYAWSGVSFNLPSVYESVMHTLTAYTPVEAELPSRPPPTEEAPPSSWHHAQQRARQLMTEQARMAGLNVEREIMLRFIPDQRMWLYRTRTDQDIRERRGATDLFFDDVTGNFVAFHPPTGRQTGRTITHWLQTLHVADIWGWPWRIFVAIMGLVTAMLSVTGILIWWRKRASASRHP